MMKRHFDSFDATNTLGRKIAPCRESGGGWGFCGCTGQPPQPQAASKPARRCAHQGGRTAAGGGGRAQGPCSEVPQLLDKMYRNRVDFITLTPVWETVACKGEAVNWLEQDTG